MYFKIHNSTLTSSTHLHLGRASMLALLSTFGAFKISVVLLGATMLFAACGKDKSDLIIGNWANTAQSYEITLAGQQDVPADVIFMEFTADLVRIIEMRCDCLPRWEHYTLTKENGKELLFVENGIHGDYVVEELTGSKMVLTSTEPNIDMGFMYTMRRN